VKSKRLRRWSVAIALVTALPLVSAGVAFWQRRGAEERAAAEQTRASQLADRQLTLAAQPTPTPVVRSNIYLAAAADVAATMQTLQSLCDAAGVAVEQLQPSSGRTSSRQPFQLSGHGAPTAVAKLLVAIEANEQLILVDGGRFVPGPAGDLGFEFGIAIQHEEVRR
jgi:hypothetical protein